MRPRRAPRAACGRAAASTALLLAAALAHAGALTVRDADGGAWTVVEDPADGAADFLLGHRIGGGAPDRRFGRDGQTAFTLGASNDAPASVRVDATRRIWMVGASLAGNQPQPVIARFLADGNADLHWGVQGKVQISPNGVAVQPNDLLPLADGSVLVAGETAGEDTPRAVVFHLKADGSLDMNFGSGGLWQRAADGDASTATSLAAATDGTAAVAVAVRGARPGAELWAMNDAPATLIRRQALDDASDGEDLRTEWVVDHWSLAAGGGPTAIVAPALLTRRAAPPSPAVVAASDPGEGGFNPFAAAAAPAPAAPPDDDGPPWPWIVALALAALAALGVVVARARRPKTVLRQTPRP